MFRPPNPATQFLRLPPAALASGRVHVAGPNGKEPDCAGSLGMAAADHRGNPNGSGRLVLHKRIGWTDDDELYPEPEAAFAAAQELAREQGDRAAPSARERFTNASRMSAARSPVRTRNERS